MFRVYQNKGQIYKKNTVVIKLIDFLMSNITSTKRKIVFLSRIKIINSFMVKSISRLLLLVVLLANNILWAQGPNRNSNNPISPLPTSTIKGTVVDAETNLPLPYVNIAIIQ